MNFPLNVYILSFLGAAITAWATLPLWSVSCRKFGLLDDPGHRKIHHAPIPLAGGLAVVTGMALPITVGLAALGLRLFDASTVDLLAYGFGRRAGQLVAIFGGAAGMLCLGVADDRWELRPLAKFGGQLAIAIGVAASGIRFELLPDENLVNLVGTVLWIVGVTNAFNFMDNMNGLCAGLGIVAAGYCGLAAAAHGQYLVALLAFLTMGALAGFLPHNFPRASAFLGDAGSHLVGFVIAVLALLPQFHETAEPRFHDLLGPVFIAAVPLADLVWVVLLRSKNRKPFYIGDTNHLSHRLVRRGLSPQRAVILIWLIAASAGALALL